MKAYRVDLMTAEGVAVWPSYDSESVTFADSGSGSEVIFTPFDGVGSLAVVSVRLTDAEDGTEINLPVDLLLSLGAVVVFGAGKLTTSGAEPAVKYGDPPPSLIRVRQLLADLMGADAAYATQSMPELEGDYTVIYQMESDQQDDYRFTALVDGFRVYDFDCTARVLVIRGGGDAQQFLRSLISRLAARRGYYWQVAHEFDVVRSQPVENAPVLVNNLTYQQQAQILLTVSFSHRESEREGWITWAEVDEGLTHATLTVEGE